jgi:SCY1-like protein 1
MDSSLVHGNLRISSIFTTKSGEWKLGGLEMAGSLKEDGAMLPLYGGQLPDSQRYAPPEVRKASWGVARK